MTTRFGWCLDGMHNACRGHVSSSNGGLYCGCDCHQQPADERLRSSTERDENLVQPKEKLPNG